MLALNKKRMAVKIIVIGFFIILLLRTNLFAVVKPTASFYVNDYAGLLDTETENYIISTNKALNSKTGAQIVVVTVPSLEGQSLEEYATELFRSFGIGDKTKNNGVLLLLALEERQFRVEVGYGLEGRLTDAKTGRIQDEYIIPYLKQNDWNNGLKNGLNAIVKEVAEEYHVQIEAQDPVEQTLTTTTADTAGKYLLISFIVNSILGVVLGILKLTNKIKWKTLFIIVSIYILSGMLILRWLLRALTFATIKFDLMALAFGFITGIGGGRRWLQRTWRWRLFWRKFFWRRPVAHQEAEEAQEASSVRKMSA